MTGISPRLRLARNFPAVGGPGVINHSAHNKSTEGDVVRPCTLVKQITGTVSCPTTASVVFFDLSPPSTVSGRGGYYVIPSGAARSPWHDSTRPGSAWVPSPRVSAPVRRCAWCRAWRWASVLTVLIRAAGSSIISCLL